MAELVTKYKQYAEYKDSGVEWLGEIPRDWEIARVKNQFNVFNGSTPKSGEAEYWEGDIVWVTPSDLSQLHNYKISESSRNITIKGLNSCGTSLVPKDSLILSCRAPIGSLAVTGTELCTNQGCKSLVPISNIPVEFYYYYFTTITSVLNNLGRGSTFLELSTEDLTNLALPLPSINESSIIVDFLNHETAQIDTLIEKQQTLIQLLKEKRQAVISHAVTKGLNPNVPMKDSGVEWLGEVPEHWMVVPVKYISKIRYGIGEPPKYQEEGIPLIRATNIRSGKISETGLVFVNSDDIPENRIIWLDKGDIIVVRSGAGTGDSSIIPSRYKGSIAGFDMVVKATGCSPEFLAYALLSNYVRNSQFDLEKMRAAQPHLNAEELGGSFILLPKDKEQKLIVDYIDREILKFDKLVINAQSAVQLMQERRTALISAAVTGKIDVRGWQAPNVETL